MRLVTRIVIFVAIITFGVLGIALSLPYDQRPSTFGLILSIVLIVAGALGLLASIVRIFVRTK